MSRNTTSLRAGRLVTAAVAGLLGVLLLSSGQGTWSAWREGATRQPGGPGSGSVSLDGSLKVELHSRQPSGSRTFASTENCPTAAPYVECRVVSGTLAAEHLVPGDTVRVVRTIVLAGEGDNLHGELAIDASRIVVGTTSQLSGAAQVSGTLRGPGGIVLTGLTHQVAVERGATSEGGFGTWTAIVDVTIPPADGAARWDGRLWTQPLDLGEVRASFTQLG